MKEQKNVEILKTYVLEDLSEKEEKYVWHLCLEKDSDLSGAEKLFFQKENTNEEIEKSVDFESLINRFESEGVISYLELNLTYCKKNNIEPQSIFTGIPEIVEDLEDRLSPFLIEVKTYEDYYKYPELTNEAVDMFYEDMAEGERIMKEKYGEHIIVD